MTVRPTTIAIPLFHKLFGSHAAHVALLDLDGKILAVNRAWMQFGHDNGLPTSYRFEEQDYLRVCEQAAARQEPYADAAMVGLLAVATLARPTFSMIYPCHSPTTARWFRLWVQTQHPESPSIIVAHTLLGSSAHVPSLEPSASTSRGFTPTYLANRQQLPADAIERLALASALPHHVGPW